MLRLFIVMWTVLYTFTSSFAQTRNFDVDVSLVLAIDVSKSVSAERWDLQKRGYATAFRDPRIIERIRSGQQGRVAVAVVLWSSKWQQRVVIDWSIIHSTQSSNEFAQRLEELERLFTAGTVISTAIKFSVDLFESAPQARRKVIDVSGDGAQYWSPVTNPEKEYTVGEARAYALSQGVTINSLALLLTEKDAERPEDIRRENEMTLAEYRAMIGGSDAFMLVVQNPYDYDEFTNAVRKKLYREMISSAGLP
jgi:hypothetical protein